MAANTKMDIKWSGNKMVGGEVLKTMECLRRRLLAERQASLLAKEEAELIGKKTKELEKQITEQIQMKTKAEKKLQLLRKKLESLNLSSAIVNSEPSISSEICDEDEPKTVTAVSTLPSTYNSIDEISQPEKENPNARGSTSSSSSTSEICSGEGELSKAKIKNGDEEFSSINDSLAIVAVNSAAKSETGAEMSERIIEVLDDLKRARERIQSSMETCELNRIKVGPV